MFHRETVFIQAAAILLFCLLTFSAEAQNTSAIGAATLVKSSAFGTQEGGRRSEMQKDDGVFLQEVVETESDSALHINFSDDTKLRLGAESKVTLDKFVYNPGAKNGELVARRAKGAFRFISGKVRKNGVQVFTPTVVIGIRGTDFTVVVGPDGSTAVEVTEGEVTVTPLGGGPTTNAGAGQICSVSAANPTAVSVTNGKGISDDQGLSDDAGVNETRDEPNTEGGGGGH